jgi:hypothetical protein
MALNHECLRYYAHAVIKSQVHQIARRSSETRYLHLMAFIVYQTFKLQDMLIDTFVISVQGAKNATEKEHKEVYYQEREGREKGISRLLDDIKKGFSDKISAIKSIVDDAGLTTDQKVFIIDCLLEEQALTPINIDKDVETIQNGSDYYDILEGRSLKLQNRVADIVRYTSFDENCKNITLLEAILHYQKRSGNIDKTAPISFLPQEERKIIFDKDKKYQVFTHYEGK